VKWGDRNNRIKRAKERRLLNMPHALYRFFDGRGRLLYVGISGELPRRLYEHDRDRSWWTEVVQITVEWLSGRHEALRAEQVAIKTEEPLYNTQGVEKETPKPQAERPGAGNRTTRRRAFVAKVLGEV
jgi:excinuclease UvrABC nuclease subunit